ncbi:Multi antimicrobial extrusion protein [Corchorus capsularis]|uniref:Multi antimicrobial extrusion protein n=1 Tax=Corchorus capsularis TaxID=210143 RepID=A0A1R3H2G5_COCAP|nr:Multi antimicrobial extrusion protein [Corchorus capsularis]
MDNILEERFLAHKEEDETTTTTNDLKRRLWNESKILWRISFPSILSRVTSFGMIVVTQSFIGHISEVQLATYALIQSILVRFIYGILIGMSSATETLCGQAFGAGHHHMMGVYLQRSWIVDGITATMLVPFFIFATPIFRILGQEEELAAAAGSISIWFIPMIYNFVLSMPISMFLQAQLKNLIVGWLSTAAFVFHVLLSWIFVNKFEWGVTGAMAAMNISGWAMVMGQLVYVIGGIATGAGLQSMVAYVNLGSYYAIGIPIGILLGYVANLQVKGLWIGLLSGVAVQSLILAFLVWKTDWDEQVRKASERLNRWLVPEEDNQSPVHA